MPEGAPSAVPAGPGGIVQGLGELGPAPSVVAIGFFDGVHLGHQSIVGRAVGVAAERGVRSVVVTFDRHPMEVVKPGSQPPLLMTLPRRARTLAAQTLTTGPGAAAGQGVDVVVVLPFDDTLRHASPAAFTDSVLTGPLQAVGVVVGANFRYGHKAAGDLASLDASGAVNGFTAEGVTLMELDGTVVSSTEIRAHVDAGDVKAAARMLGRPHILDGVVVRGDQRGAALGFPTANVQVDPRVAIPGPGVYAGRFHTADGTAHDAAVSIGTNPTFGGQDLRIEAYLLDGSFDLYGMAVAVDFRHRLRRQQHYDGADALVEQMHRDVARARELLASAVG